MKKIKSILAATLAICMCLSMAGCGAIEETADKGSTESNILVKNTDEQTENAKTAEQQDDTSSKDTQASKSNTAYNTRDGYMRFIPQIENTDIVKVDADFLNFTIADKEYNLLDNTISDIIEGNRMTASSLQRSLTDNKDYYFKGDCFRQDNRDGIVTVYIQQMINGEPVLGYDESMKDDYELFGIRIDALEDGTITDEMMTFASGVKLYMTPHDVELILGKGTKGDFGYLDYPTYYYQTDDAIMAIVYTRYDNDENKPMRARQITIVKKSN